MNYAYEQLMNDPDVDIVIAYGELATNVAVFKDEYSKPLIAAIAINSELQNMPLKDGTSGVSNLNYISFTANILTQLPNMSFGRYFECKKQSILMSGYLGSIGLAYPAAMGAWAAAPDRPIVSVTGDGGFAQYMAELNTAVKYKMNIKHILLNNNELGKISKEQIADQLEVWETDLTNPDYSKYAELCGAMGIRVTKKEELDAAMKKAFEHKGPAMVKIITDPLLN
jgi:glyoxylate carboligase